MISEYNIPEDKPVILLGGRITHWKGQHLLIKALARMKNQNFYCIIAGDDQGRKDYLDYLKKLAQKYNLSSRVGFHGKVLDMPALMSVSSVIVSAAIEPEAFGRISVEGQAMGKIVVASNIGGSLDTITDGVTGKLFESNNPHSLADALDWALSLDDKTRNKIVKAGIENVKNNFTKDIMCDKTIEVYKELV
jgi:glycosyltransferase involved in cell wall biosynthesis